MIARVLSTLRFHRYTQGTVFLTLSRLGPFPTNPASLCERRLLADIDDVRVIQVQDDDDDDLDEDDEDDEEGEDDEDEEEDDPPGWSD